MKKPNKGVEPTTSENMARPVAEERQRIKDNWHTWEVEYFFKRFKFKR